MAGAWSEVCVVLDSLPRCPKGRILDRADIGAEDLLHVDRLLVATGSRGICRRLPGHLGPPALTAKRRSPTARMALVDRFPGVGDRV